MLFHNTRTSSTNYATATFWQVMSPATRKYKSPSVRQYDNSGHSTSAVPVCTRRSLVPVCTEELLLQPVCRRAQSEQFLLLQYSFVQKSYYFSRRAEGLKVSSLLLLQYSLYRRHTTSALRAEDSSFYALTATLSFWTRNQQQAL